MKINKISSKFIKELLFWGIIVGVMFAALRWIGPGTLQLSLRGIAFLAMVMVAVFIHLHNGARKENYIRRDILALEGNSKRSYRYDYLRVIAVSFVILTHAIQADLSKGYVTDAKQVQLYTILYILTCSCNSIYVMLSGALLLPYKEEKLTDFYIRRVSVVGLPLVIYYFFYLWQNLQLGDITLALLKDIFYRLLQGNTPESPHYWMIYTILSLYIVIPFFRYMMKDIPYQKLTALSVIIILFMALTIFSGIGLAINTFMGSWIGVAVLGYWVTREETAKYYKLLMVIGIGNIAAAIYLIRTNENFIYYICNCSPVITLITVGILAFIFSNGKFFDKGNWGIRFLSKYSYSILLIHWWSLYWITSGRFQIRINAWGGGGLILSYLVTVGVSALVGFLIDNLAVVVAEFIFSHIVSLPRLIFRNPARLPGRLGGAAGESGHCENFSKNVR